MSRTCEVGRLCGALATLLVAPPQGQRHQVEPIRTCGTHIGPAIRRMLDDVAPSTWVRVRAIEGVKVASNSRPVQGDHIGRSR